MTYDNSKSLTENAAKGEDITVPNITYKVAAEWSAPTYYDTETNEQLFDESSQSIQCYWVVSYNEDEHEVEEWIERFTWEQDAIDYKAQIERGINERA